MLCGSFLTLPLPRRAIETARKRGREASWVEAGNIVTSGPLLILESRQRERTVVAKNWNYFDAALVALEKICFYAAEGAVALNLFRTGEVDSMDGSALPVQLAARLRRMEGFHETPA